MFEWQIIVGVVVSSCLSIIAVYLALVRYINIRDFTVMTAAFEELQDLYSALSASHKRLRSRVGMRELRERRKGGNGDPPQPPTPPGNDPYNSADQLSTEEERARWKKQMRLALHSGQLKPR